MIVYYFTFMHFPQKLAGTVITQHALNYCFSLRMATGSLDAPKNITFDTSVVDICCHPSKDVIAVGDIDGNVTVYVNFKYKYKFVLINQKKLYLRIHTKKK